MDKTSLRFLGSAIFWAWSLPVLAVAGTFFAWELTLVDLPLPDLPRYPATPFEIAFSALLAALLALVAGLFAWQRRYGACPVGSRRSAGVAGTLGAVALLCPVCLVLPASFVGLTALFTLLLPFLPLIRLIAVVFAILSVWLLWPRPRPPSTPARTSAPEDGHAGNRIV